MRQTFFPYLKKNSSNQLSAWCQNVLSALLNALPASIKDEWNQLECICG